MEKRQILNELLKILTKYLKVNVNFGENYENDRYLFRGLCNQCLELKGIDEKFYNLQDQLLSIEREEKGVVDVDALKFKNNLAIFKGDITTLKADAIVNAANDQYLGCFVPCHNCIDNIIMSASGFQMRNELMDLKKQINYDKEPVKVTKGYNLHCKFVFHIAGPQIFDEVTKKDKQDLVECYINALNKAKQLGLKNIVFCCISTGLYCFPNDLAAEIATNTVKDWLNKNKSDIKVVFNVFKDIDEVLYNERLR